MKILLPLSLIFNLFSLGVVIDGILGVISLHDRFNLQIDPRAEVFFGVLVLLFACSFITSLYLLVRTAKKSLTISKKLSVGLGVTSLMIGMIIPVASIIFLILS